MMRAAQARGHEVWAATAETLAWASDTGVQADAVRLQLADDDAHWYSEGRTPRCASPTSMPS